VPFDPATKRHPLVIRKIANLGDTPKVDVDRVPANEAYLSILREVSKVLVMRDIMEKFVACRCFPMREGWAVSTWAAADKEVYGLPMPNFTEVFKLWKERKFFLKGFGLKISLFGFQSSMPTRWRPAPTRFSVLCLGPSTTCC